MGTQRRGTSREGKSMLVELPERDDMPEPGAEVCQQREEERRSLYRFVVACGKRKVVCAGATTCSV